MRRILLPLVLLMLSWSPALLAQSGLAAVTVTPAANGGQTYTVTIQILLLMTVLSLLPAGLIMMTSFTRIIVVLAILRQAMGTAQTPSNQILLGLALFLSLFIMAPVFQKAYEDGLKPYLDETMAAEEALQKAGQPFKQFMLDQTREEDQRAQDRLPDRLPHLSALPGHRPGGGQRAHGHGHDDALAHDHLYAVQADAVRAGGWLVAHHGHPGFELLLLRMKRQ